MCLDSYRLAFGRVAASRGQPTSANVLATKMGIATTPPGDAKKNRELVKMPDAKTRDDPETTPDMALVLAADDAEFYRRYLESCRRLGVEPVKAERVRALVGEWNRLVHGESDATTTH
jgi:hypothetical protein